MGEKKSRSNEVGENEKIKNEIFKSDATKAELIKKETRRLKGIFKGLDENKRKTVEKLIGTTAFMGVSLGELEEIINREGYVEEYQNGENQRGVKKSAAVDIHLAMTKNYTAAIKQLADLAPPAAKKKSKFEMFRGGA